MRQLAIMGIQEWSRHERGTGGQWMQSPMDHPLDFPHNTTPKLGVCMSATVGMWGGAGETGKALSYPLRWVGFDFSHQDANLDKIWSLSGRELRRKQLHQLNCGLAVRHMRRTDRQLGWHGYATSENLGWPLGGRGARPLAFTCFSATDDLVPWVGHMVSVLGWVIRRPFQPQTCLDMSS